MKSYVFQKRWGNFSKNTNDICDLGGGGYAVPTTAQHTNTLCDPLEEVQHNPAVALVGCVIKSTENSHCQQEPLTFSLHSLVLRFSLFHSVMIS